MPFIFLYLSFSYMKEKYMLVKVCWYEHPIVYTFFFFTNTDRIGLFPIKRQTSVDRKIHEATWRYFWGCMEGWINRWPFNCNVQGSQQHTTTLHLIKVSMVLKGNVEVLKANNKYKIQVTFKTDSCKCSLN